MRNLIVTFFILFIMTGCYVGAERDCEKAMNMVEENMGIPEEITVYDLGDYYDHTWWYWTKGVMWIFTWDESTICVYEWGKPCFCRISKRVFNSVTKEWEEEDDFCGSVQLGKELIYYDNLVRQKKRALRTR